MRIKFFDEEYLIHNAIITGLLGLLIVFYFVIHDLKQTNEKLLDINNGITNYIKGHSPIYDTTIVYHSSSGKSDTTFTIVNLN